VYFNVNFNVLFKLINCAFLVSELYVYQNEWCKSKKKISVLQSNVTIVMRNLLLKLSKRTLATLCYLFKLVDYCDARF
jgi:hypothetical protein